VHQEGARLLHGRQIWRGPWIWPGLLEEGREVGIRDLGRRRRNVIT
jgi:hypothetical protein